MASEDSVENQPTKSSAKPTLLRQELHAIQTEPRKKKEKRMRRKRVKEKRMRRKKRKWRRGDEGGQFSIVSFERSASPRAIRALFAFFSFFFLLHKVTSFGILILSFSEHGTAAHEP